VVTPVFEHVALARHLMATRFELVLPVIGDAARLRAAGEEALDEVERLEGRLSAYLPTSDISRLNARAADDRVPVAPWLFGLLKTARELTLMTGGAFDITVGPLLRAWGFVGGAGRMADPNVLEAARELVGPDRIVLDDTTSSVHFDRPGVALDLGAIGKGYAVDAALSVLRDNGVASALMHGGTSTVGVIGAPPDAEGWNVAIAAPPDTPAIQATVTLRDGDTLSVSAPHGKAFTDADGRALGHVLDPRTGRPAEAARLAAVVCSSATEGDALSTALLVAGPDAFALVARRRPEASALVVSADGSAHILGQDIALSDTSRKDIHR
jgi:thiamine biosynthesis lipoprotein